MKLKKFKAVKAKKVVLYAKVSPEALAFVKTASKKAKMTMSAYVDLAIAAVKNASH